MKMLPLRDASITPQNLSKNHLKQRNGAELTFKLEPNRRLLPLPEEIDFSLCQKVTEMKKFIERSSMRSDVNAWADIPVIEQLRNCMAHLKGQNHSFDLDPFYPLLQQYGTPQLVPAHQDLRRTNQLVFWNLEQLLKDKLKFQGTVSHFLSMGTKTTHFLAKTEAPASITSLGMLYKGVKTYFGDGKIINRTYSPIEFAYNFTYPSIQPQKINRVLPNEKQEKEIEATIIEIEALIKAKTIKNSSLK